MSEEERFWAKVDRTGACWMWRGAIAKNGYGTHRFGGKTTYAHRLAYTLTKGAIPAGHDVCHTCDVRGCVRPDHLFAGTRTDNMRDAKAKGRTALGDKNRSRKYPEKVHRGENAYQSKLTEDLVRAIRAFYAKGGANQREVADHFGLNYGTVKNVIRRANWKHVE